MARRTGVLTVNGGVNLREALAAAGAEDCAHINSMLLVCEDDTKTFYFGMHPDTNPGTNGIAIGSGGILKTLEYSRVDISDSSFRADEVWLHTAEELAIKFAIVGGNA